MRLPYIIILSFIITSFCNGAHLLPGFVEEQVATGLDPSSMRMAPDGRLFITQKNGVVNIIENDVLIPDPFVVFEVDNFNERGLGGMAIHPDFEQNGYVYFYYTVPGKNFNQIVRVTANGNFAVPGSEEVIFEIDPLNGNIHMGGDMHFGPDGKLYVSIGDGTNGVAPSEYNSLLGKMIRINDDGSIPSDNPFYDTLEGKYRAIWALGLRNSFSTAIHPESGRIFGCDVGSEDWEEVNDIVAGAYYGWAELEGPQTNELLPDNYKDPFYAYDHSEGCAIIGATFYTPKTTTWPERYLNKFFFADYCDGYIKVLDPETARIEITFATRIDRPISLLTAPNGDMYYIARGGIGDGSMRDNTSSVNGSIWRISYQGTGAPFISKRPVDLNIPKNEDAIFSIEAVGENTLIYQWYENDTLIEGATDKSLVIKNVKLSQSGNVYQCRVQNEINTVISGKALLTVLDNSRPIPTIYSPEINSTYVAGDVLQFSGSATDPEDGSLADSLLTWSIDFHHDDHTHPALVDYKGYSSGQFTIPVIGEVDDNVWYRVHLYATDHEELSANDYVDIYPIKTEFLVKSEPSGLDINIDGRRAQTPETIVSVAGLERTIAAPQHQFRNDTFFTFSHWNTPEDTSRFMVFTAGMIPELIAHYDIEPIFVGDGRGLTADFFEGVEESDLNSQKPIITRLDRTVDFNWEEEAPVEGLPTDLFMVRWRGEIMAPVNDLYRFIIASDDGVRLWIDDQLIIDQWIDQATTESIGFIELEGGKKYRIRLDYYDRYGHAVVQLKYRGSRTPETIIPTSQLFPDPFLNTEETFNLNIYPVPAQKFVNVRLSVWKKENVKWNLLDSSGRRLEAGEWPVQVGTNIFSINVAHLPSGIYHLSLEGTDEISGLYTFYKQL